MQSLGSAFYFTPNCFCNSFCLHLFRTSGQACSVSKLTKGKNLFSLLSFQEGKYHEALSRWEAALTLAPDNAILHEQKAQVLLEVGDAWHALTAATSMLLFSPSYIYSVVLQKRTWVGNNTNCSTDYYLYRSY